jgi:hypothetical protein
MGYQKTQEMKMNKAEMKMLRFASGHTRMDNIENKDIRKKTKVTEMQTFGHIQRRLEEFVAKRVLRMEVEGKRARGCPRRRWMECIKEDLAEKKLKTRIQGLVHFKDIRISKKSPELPVIDSIKFVLPKFIFFY